jgi:hypothetical protein
MSNELSEECAVIAFYGLSRFPTGVEAVYNKLLNWCQTLGWPPDQLAVGGDGFSAKLASFSRVNARLQKNGFEKVEFIEFYSTAPGEQIHQDGWALTASISLKSKRFILAARSSLASLTTTSLLPVARFVLEHLKPAYGIGFRRLHKLGASYYAIGLPKLTGFSAADRKEAERINNWSVGNRLEVYRDGVLRDIYPWNFLTRPHLDRQIDCLSLEQWVRQDGRRGHLDPLSDECFLWALNEAEIAEVKPVVEQAGLIFDRANYRQQLEEEYQRQREIEKKSRVRITKADRAKRDALIAKVLEQYRTNTGVACGHALVSLEDFFNGNKIRDSIAVNLMGSRHPDIGVFYDVLREIRAKPVVQDVLIAIHETPDPAEPADNDEWLQAGFIVVLTSASSEEIESWVVPLNVDNVVPGWGQLEEKAHGLPKPAPGMSVWRLGWD